MSNTLNSPPTQPDNFRKEVKEKIKELRERGRGDYESLIKQVDKNRRQLMLNVPQMLAYISPALYKVLEWGRGTGKTTYRGAHWSAILNEMPRSTGIVPAVTYKAMLTDILPSIINGLELFGIFEGLHYFIGERPPKAWRGSWGTPYRKPKKYDYYITFWNGTGASLASQDIIGDGRGSDRDWMDVDEAAMLNGQRIQSEIEPTLRGTNTKKFKGNRFFGSRLISTSAALTQEGTWYQKYEELALYYPKKYTFIKATSHQNKDNLREGFLEEAKETAYEKWVYEAEYENIRPNIVKNGFYATLDVNRHAYNNYNYNHLNKIGQKLDCRADNDLVRGQPLIGSMDFGAVINSLTLNQHLKSINEYRTLKSMFVLGDDKKIQDDLIDDFHEYYQPHQSSCNEIYLWYDNSGNIQTGNTRLTRARQVQEQLRKLGWKVTLMTTGQANPSHEMKQRLWQAILAEQDQRFPRYRMNKGNCRELWISMRNAKAKRSQTGLIQKDKSVEHSSKIPRQEATDLSDANDAAIWGMFSYLMNGFGGYIPPDSYTRS